MRFANTLVLLVALCAAAAVPLFIGHGLSSHHYAWVAYGGVAAFVAGGLMLLHVRMVRDTV
ncbi:MAG TPA: hypothetical protein VK837_10250 [Longimicrobiales bacterium]|nr:hypothetical protein [Longimicrobiales bacterium]